jgi:hypothetical protein
MSPLALAADGYRALAGNGPAQGCAVGVQRRADGTFPATVVIDDGRGGRHLYRFQQPAVTPRGTLVYSFVESVGIARAA